MSAHPTEQDGEKYKFTFKERPTVRAPAYVCTILAVIHVLVVQFLFFNMVYFLPRYPVIRLEDFSISPLHNHSNKSIIKFNISVENPNKKDGKPDYSYNRVYVQSRIYIEEENRTCWELSEGKMELATLNREAFKKMRHSIVRKLTVGDERLLNQTRDLRLEISIDLDFSVINNVSAACSTNCSVTLNALGKLVDYQRHKKCPYNNIYGYDKR